MGIQSEEMTTRARTQRLLPWLRRVLEGGDVGTCSAALCSGLGPGLTLTTTTTTTKDVVQTTTKDVVQTTTTDRYRRSSQKRMVGGLGVGVTRDESGDPRSRGDEASPWRKKRHRKLFHEKVDWEKSLVGTFGTL